jgi:hypothetical protein
VARAFRFLALLAAFFVVVARAASGLSLAVASATPGFAGSGISAACPSRGAPADQDSSAVADLDDDSDDSADALIAPAPVRLVALADEAGAALGCTAWVEQRALASHALTLERPPRA